MLEYCKEKRIVIQAYSPLTRTKRLNEPILTEIATTYNKTPAQVLIRWNIQYGVAPIPKATGQEHIREDSAVFDFALTTKDMAILDSLNQHYSALSTLPYIRL
jgi:2,5-diketo-D-gluconate reductase A